MVLLAIWFQLRLSGKTSAELEEYEASSIEIHKIENE